MKFDPFSWQEVKPNENVQVQKGWLRVRASAPSPLYVEAEGVEALVGVGTTFDVEISEAVSFRVEAANSVRVFLHRLFGASVHASGEVFTNIDRMPDESGSVMEVRRALRQLEIERRAALREIRAARDAARQSVGPDPAPEAEPASEAEPELPLVEK